MTKTPTRTEAVAWRRAQQALACDELVPWEHGTVLLTPSAPTYWDCNFVRVEGAVPDVDAPALMAAARALLGLLDHRKVEVEDEVAGARLRPAFAAAGWHTERLAVMLRTGPPPAAPAGVEEVPLREARDLRAEWYAVDASDPEADDEDRPRELYERLGFATVWRRHAFTRPAVS